MNKAAQLHAKRMRRALWGIISKCALIFLFVAPFCLVTLLIILTALPIDVFRVRGKAAMKVVATDFVSLEHAVTSFFVEYRNYPIPESADYDIRMDTGPALMTALTGFPGGNELNPRELPFFMGRPARKSPNGGWRRGLVYSEKPSLFDPWGNLYHIVIDADLDNRIKNPNPEEAKENPFITSGSIIWSSGPDGDPKTWKDNISSWEY